MSDTPSPAPDSALKPKLTLTPKAPASATDAAAPAAPALEGSIAPAASPALQPGLGNSSATPTSLSAPRTGAPKPSLKLQGTPHPANLTDAPAFKSPMPAAIDDSPSMAIVVLSFLAAAAALTFAYLLYVKNQ